jgi:hypothetical protein
MRWRGLPAPAQPHDDHPKVWSVEIDDRERLCLGTKVSVPSEPWMFRLKLVEMPEELQR